MKREKGLIITLIALAVMTFASGSNSLAGSDFKVIDTTKLHAMIVNNAYELEGGREKPFIIVDARTKEEYDEVHIFSSVNIPENDFEKFMTLLPKDKSVQLVVYCNDMKSDTSQKWAGKAAAAGYLDIVIYKEGFLIWKEDKMPTAPINGI